MALEALEKPVEGAPRIGPPLSTYSLADEVYGAAEGIGINLYPWQQYGLDISMSIDEDWSFLHREVAFIASRQNGKSKILVPRIKWALDNGRQVIHTAQDRSLPRVVLLELASALPEAKVRLANGQESIRHPETGGKYTIVAPQRGARGMYADDLIIDELREMEDFDFIAAAEPTLTQSPNPQVIYLSNAGTEKSLVLNDLRTRGLAGDPALAYMEWSAGNEYAVDDPAGWLEANPSIGYGNLTIARLQSLYDKYQSAGELAIFETEHLCRWVKSMAPRLVSDVLWQQARGPIEEPNRPCLGISVHPSGKGASAVLAWMQSDGSIAIRVEADVTGDPISLPALAADLVPRAQALGVQVVGFDSWTDQHLARHFEETEPIVSQAFANASERFVRGVETGGIRWQHADAISDQLPYASRKDVGGTAWAAEPVDRHRPITAVLAAIRAVWLASNPTVLKPAVY